MKTLSQLLTLYREEKGITRAQLSVLSGIKETHLDRIEQGETKPTMPIVFRICRAMDVDPLLIADGLATEFHAQVQSRFPARPLPDTSAKVAGGHRKI